MAAVNATHERQAISLFRTRHRHARADRQRKEARPARADPQPGDVRRGDRLGHNDGHLADPGLRRQTARRRPRARLVHVHDRDLAVADGDLRQHGRGVRRGTRARPGRHAAQHAQGDGRHDAGRLEQGRLGAGARRRRRGRRGRADPGRRQRDRGHRDRGRVGHHRRVRSGDPRVRRRPLRGDRRHARDLRPDRRRNHPGAGQVVPGPHDRAGRGGRAAQDAERDRAEHPACRANPDLHDRRRHAAPVRPVRRHLDLRDDADRAAGGADPDHDRRAAERDRHRRHGPTRAPQRAGAVRSRGRGQRRRGRAAAGQDRHDHARQPPGLRVHPDAGRGRVRAGRGGAAGVACRRDARGALDRRAGQAVRHPRARHGADQCGVRARSPRRRG